MKEEKVTAARWREREEEREREKEAPIWFWPVHACKPSSACPARVTTNETSNEAALPEIIQRNHCTSKKKRLREEREEEREKRERRVIRRGDKEDVNRCSVSRCFTSRVGVRI